MKILVACGNGMGSSVILKMKIESVLREYGVDATVEAVAVGEAVSIANSFDYLLYPSALETRVKSVTIPKTGVTNILFEKEIKEAFTRLGIIK